MKILFVVARPLEINTSASIRNRATIDGLIRLGHNVDIITTAPDKNHPNYDSSLMVSNLNIKYLKLGGIQTVARIGRKFKFLYRIKHYMHKYLKKVDIYDNLKGIVNHIDKINVTDEEYDLVISSSDPKSSHLFVRKMYESKILIKTPWIQIWGDPFLLDITINNSNKLNRKIKREEKRLLEFANKVIYVSNVTLIKQKTMYPEYASKMTYYPIPYMNEEIYPEVDYSKKSLTFLYCGDYPRKIRNIEPLYNAINKTKHKLIICGNSDMKLNSTDNIEIYPRVSFDKTKEYERECDVLVHICNLCGTQIPGKIYQYAGTNKPILFILDGDKSTFEKEFSQYNRFIFCDNTEESILHTLNNFGEACLGVTNKPLEEFKSYKIAKDILQLN